jgi:hypothetical protein
MRNNLVNSDVICLNNWPVTWETIWCSLVSFILTIDPSHEKQSGQVWRHFCQQWTRHMINNMVKSDVICLGNNRPVTWETIWSNLMSFVLRMEPWHEKQSGEVWCPLAYQWRRINYYLFQAIYLRRERRILRVLHQDVYPVSCLIVDVNSSCSIW